MQIKDLYTKYEIMPQLAEHMLRVGGIGERVARAWKGNVDVKYVTRLCLLHDVGNVVKFDLSDEAVKAKMFNRVVDLSYWRDVQKKYRERYGKDAHAATKGILTQAGLEIYTQDIDEEAKLYFSEASKKKLEQTRAPTIILMYADCRVMPQGIVSYRERLSDLVKRYGGGKSPTWYPWMFQFENWLKSKLTIEPETIKENEVREEWERLLELII